MTWNSTFTKPPKPLPRKSAKRVSEDKDFAPIRQACFDRDGRCMAPIEWGICEGRWHAHHVVSRARDRTLALVLENLRTLCAKHHQHTHDHVAESTRLGLLASAPHRPQDQG